MSTPLGGKAGSACRMKPLEVSREGDGDEILGYNMDTVFLEGMTSEKF